MMEGKASRAGPRGMGVHAGDEYIERRPLQCTACGRSSDFSVVVSGDARNVICTCACGHGSFTIVNYHDEAGAAKPQPGEMVVFEEIDPQGEVGWKGREMRKGREA